MPLVQTVLNTVAAAVSQDNSAQMINDIVVKGQSVTQHH